MLYDVMLGFPGGTSGKDPPAYAGDIRDVSLTPGLGRSLEKEMATHSSILAWGNLMDSRDWPVTGHRVTQSWT